MNIVFIGGLTNGKIVYDYLSKNKFVNLVLCITYPDGLNKPRHVNFPDESHIIKSGSASKCLLEIKNAKPDLIIVAGWSELLSDEILNIAPMGAIGFHPSKLPSDRGRSVLAWQIAEGYLETALTMFYYNNLPDAGDIIASEIVKIEENDYIGDILEKMDEATFSLMKAYFPLIRQGVAPRKKQSINEGNFRRLRTERDSFIDWNSNMELIYNKIRALAPPYPCAITTIENNKIRIIKAEKLLHFPIDFKQSPEMGRLIAKFIDGSLLVNCRDGFIRILEFESI